MENIYLDNAATTKPDQKVIEAMSRVSEEAWGNPSSIHSVGQEAALEVDNGRETVAKFLGCDATEVIFTSGGSESDNLALRGLVGSLRAEAGSISSNLKPQATNTLPHIITGAGEHHAVLHTVQELEKEGLIEATYLNPDANGLITPEHVIEAIRDNTILVSLMYVNNETGVVTPIAEIGKRLLTFNFELSTRNKSAKRIYFHTDAVQAAEWLDMNVQDLGVDLLTFTSHKIHGPKGIGVLYAKKGTPIKHQISGGDQEFRLRAGTENVASIAGIAQAITNIERGAADRVQTLRDRLIDGVVKNISDAIVNGGKAPRSPHIANISFLNAEGEAIILNLDFLGIQVSSGSACTSRSLNPSHVLSSMGVPPEKAHGSIRFSLSRETTAEEIDKVIEVLPGIILKLRQMSPFK
ncbi:MAG: cysteine desulfurase family protein [Patescibacteria group bacterium]|jgi:cysteine desulfurase